MSQEIAGIFPMSAELIKDYWKAVGCDMTMKGIGSEIYTADPYKREGLELGKVR